MASYRELSVWKKAMDLADMIYQLIPLLPPEERFGISDQMRRAAVSIPSNIAEGQVRASKKDFLRFLYVAQGSRAELDTQLEICTRTGFLSQEETQSAKILCDEIGRMLRVMISRLEAEE